MPAPVTGESVAGHNTKEHIDIVENFLRAQADLSQGAAE